MVVNNSILSRNKAEKCTKSDQRDLHGGNIVIFFEIEALFIYFSLEEKRN